MKQTYIDFLKSKMAISSQTGFDISESDLTPTLYPHVKDTVRWAVKGGCRAIFSSFGMQKTCTQLEIERVIIEKVGGVGLIVCPKRVVVEFITQAKQYLDMEVSYVKTMDEVRACKTPIMITNYERVRDGEPGVRIDPNYFTVTSLDEASVLRGYGTKTFQDFLPLFAGVQYRFVATATPSPNRYKELIHYAGYLGIMDTGQALTRFFQRDSTKANNLTIYPGKEREFWLWVSTWALFLTKPSDLGYPDEGYELPPLHTFEEVVEVDNDTAGYDADGAKMGVGCPEYILLFRKLPTDTSRAYADDPVTKNIKDYSLARWQIDAHADWKSSGNRLLSYDDVRGLGIETVRAYFRKFSEEHVYNYEAHVKFAEDMEAAGKLPKTFMAIDPVSHKDYIWDDVTRMRTLNTRQSQKNRQNHICPLQLDICERIIERYSNKGDVVFDPFGGIQSVPYCAVKLGRRGLSTELNYNYWKDGLTYLREAEQEMTSPTLFDFMNEAI